MSPLSNEPMTELTKPQPIKEIDILWITAGLGTLGDHGTTIMIARGELDLETDIESDCAFAFARRRHAGRS
jgi:hydrogenase maturation factor